MTERRMDYFVTGALLSGMKWEDDCYASLRVRFDLYDDQIFCTKYKKGLPEATYAVDPADLGAALGGLSIKTGLLPPNCLFWGRKDGLERLGIYVEPGVWRVAVQGHKEAWDIPLPGFVFIGVGRKYSLYAVKLPPTGPQAKLYEFPAPNMGAGGVCQGNAPFPLASGATIWDAVYVFFQSKFNKHLAGGRSQAYEDNILEMWEKLHATEAAAYPVIDLVSANKTLQGVI